MTDEVAIPELAEGESVKLAFRATVYATMTRAGVTRVSVEIDDEDTSGIGPWVFDSTGNVTDQGVNAASKWAREVPWPPLNGLPVDVVWEG